MYDVMGEGMRGRGDLRLPCDPRHGDNCDLILRLAIQLRPRRKRQLHALLLRQVPRPVDARYLADTLYLREVVVDGHVRACGAEPRVKQLQVEKV